VAIWRPKLTARSDPDHDHVVAQIVARLTGLPRRAVVLAETETHLNLARMCGPADAARRALGSPYPGHEPEGHRARALEVSTGRWVYRLGRRCAADFIALLDQVLRAFPRAPVIAVICDNDSIATPARSPPIWRNTPACSRSTAPATARTTTRPRCGCLSASCVGLLLHGYRGPCPSGCRSGCRCRSSGTGCGSRPAADAARGGVRLRRSLR
jgi:hypothetical protein